MEKASLLDRTIDSFFSMRKSTFYLLLIFLIGLIFRIIGAINLSVSADDMHHVTHAINFLQAGRLITYDQSSGLWHAFTSVIYGLFGTTQIASRFASILFGSLSIIIIYLFSREFFNEKISLIAALLLSLAPFHLTNTVAEMDITAMFFALTSMLFFVRATKTSKSSNYILSGIFIGLSVYTKVYPLLFIPSMLLYLTYINYKQETKILSKENTKKIVIFLAFAFIFMIPALAHNYLLYTDKGFMDLQFTRTFGLGKEESAQYYAWDHQFDAKNDWKGLIFGGSTNSASPVPTLLTGIDFIRLGDPLVFYLGIIGILWILFYDKTKRNYLMFFLLNIIFILPFLSSIILLSKHYLFLELLLVPLSAFAIGKISLKLSSVFKKNSLKIILLVVILISLLILGISSTPKLYQPGFYNFYGKSHIAQLIDFKEERIPENSLIVADSRIYRGRINWFSQDRFYMEGTEFLFLASNPDQIQGNEINIEVYFVECIPDDCGWGTVKDQPDFNNSMESLTDFFKQNGELVETISEPIEQKIYYPLISRENRFDVINIYRANLQTRESLIAFASQPKQWFLYDIGYSPKENQFDYYQTSGFFNSFLDNLAHWIVWIAVILAFISPLFVVYLLIKRK